MKRYLRIAAMAALVLVFGAAGLTKLADPAPFTDQFARLGLPEWWIPVTGTVELLGAALIALSKPLARIFGATVLAITMAVATALHLLHDPFVLALPASLLMLLAAYVALVARNEATSGGLAGA